MKLLPMFILLFIASLSFAQAPDYNDDDYPGGSVKICKFSFKIKSKAKFDYDYKAKEWCDSFDKFSKHCRFRQLKSGGWQSNFFYSHSFEGRNTWSSVNQYFIFLNKNNFLKNRFEHIYRIKDCS